MLIKRMYIPLFCLGLLSCGEPEKPSQRLYHSIDELYDQIVESAAPYKTVTDIDHARLAQAEGVTMPPSRVYIFSDAQINTRLLALNPMVGLDLPFKVLAYSDNGKPSVIYTRADFIKRRHGIEEGVALDTFRKSLAAVTEPLPELAITHFDTADVEEGFAIEALKSDYEFRETITRLKKAIMAEEDTVWFSEIDYQAEAKPYAVQLPKLTLLLFGGPAPGGKAMAEFPRMGLDAFCQKILVREMPDGRVEVYYNNLQDFAKLHHDGQAIPHFVINYRLGQTLGGAIAR